MTKKKVSFGVFFGGISIIVSGLSGIIIYPILLKSLSEEIAGLWLFYSSFTIVMNLGQAGLAPIVMRRAAEALMDGSQESLAKLKSLVNRSYFFVSILVLSICLLLFFTHVVWILKENNDIYLAGLISWWLFVLGNLINIYYSKNYYILNGFGEVGLDKLVQIINSVLTILGYYITLNLGFGLIGLSFIYLIASIVNACLSNKLLKKYSPKNLNFEKTSVSKIDLLQIFKEGAQIMVLNLVGILVMNKDLFLVQRFQGLKIIPEYSAFIRIQGIIITISLLIPQMSSPFITQNFAIGNYDETRKIYLKSVIKAVTISIIMSVLLLIYAESIFLLWLGKDNYLGDDILFLVLLLGFIYLHHNSHANAVIATGKNSFVIPAVINGVLSLFFAYVGIKYWGIKGMIFGNIIATVFPSLFVVIYSIRFFKRLERKVS